MRLFAPTALRFGARFPPSRERRLIPNLYGPGGRGGFISAPARRLFLALSYQTIWFQQLAPTQVRFLVSLFRMTWTVDLICIR